MNISDAFSYPFTKCVAVAIHFVNGQQKALQSKRILLTGLQNALQSQPLLLKGNKMRCSRNAF